ncbi:MAG: hypothetical protein M3256_17990 [Actinomycetota bacterium]|nr:hypothetical protein [Actinomycetota bacterium]
MVAMLAATVALIPVVARAWRRPSHANSPPTSTTASPAWTALDPQQRCDNAVALVITPNLWRTTCRWRQPTDGLEGSAFPPPKGDPPFDDPHIEIYVDPAQTRESLAHAIAHEMGHMRHTREPTFVPEWLAARGLPPDTPSSVWTEDYAETFAALFGPPNDSWRAPTPRPDAAALAGLKAQFFS